MPRAIAADWTRLPTPRPTAAVPLSTSAVVALTSNALGSIDAWSTVPRMANGRIGTSTQIISVPKRARKSRNPASSISPTESGRSCGVYDGADKGVPLLGWRRQPSTRCRRTSTESAAVLALVVGPVVARADRLPPGPVVAVPGDRALESFGEPHLRLPAQRARLRGAQRVAAVVPRPVGHVLDQRLGGAGVLDDPLDDLDVRRFVGPADVVDLAGLAALEHDADPAREVLDVDPVAHLHPVAVDRELVPVEGVEHHQGYQLLRILVRAVVVRAAADHRLEPVGVAVGGDEQVGAGLGRRVGGRRLERRLLGERALLDRAVDLVGRDLEVAE